MKNKKEKNLRVGENEILVVIIIIIIITVIVISHVIIDIITIRSLLLIISIIIVIISIIIVIIIIMRKYNPIVIEVNISYRTYDLPMITGIFNFLSAFTESIGCRTVMLERIPWENRVSLW